MIIVGGVGLSMLVAGTALAYAAEIHAAYTGLLELIAGLLIVTGLALIGVAVNGSFPSGFIVE